MPSRCRQRRIPLVLTMLVWAALACSLPTAAATSTPPAPATATATAGGGSVGGGSVGANTGASPTATATPTATSTATATATPTATDTPTDTPVPTPASKGPYVVKQTIVLGKETLSGAVCKLTDPFFVTSTAPKVTFIFNFAPQAADH